MTRCTCIRSVVFSHSKLRVSRRNVRDFNWIKTRWILLVWFDGRRKLKMVPGQYHFLSVQYAHPAGNLGDSAIFLNIAVNMKCSSQQVGQRCWNLYFLRVHCLKGLKLKIEQQREPREPGWPRQWHRLRNGSLEACQADPLYQRKWE